MATSKTLTPTNVTIQIPEFTDQPDQRVNSNCIDKEADAINALNTAIGNIQIYVNISNNDYQDAKFTSALTTISNGNYTADKSYTVMFVFGGQNFTGSFTGTVNLTSGGIRFLVGDETRVYQGLFLRSSNTLSSIRELSSYVTNDFTVPVGATSFATTGYSPSNYDIISAIKVNANVSSGGVIQSCYPGTSDFTIYLTSVSGQAASVRVLFRRK